MARIISEKTAEKIRDAVILEIAESPGEEIAYGGLKRNLTQKFPGITSMTLIYRDMQFFGVLALRDFLVEIGFATRKVVSKNNVFRAEYIRL